MVIDLVHLFARAQAVRQGKTALQRGRGGDVVALVLAVAVQVALFRVADADVSCEVDVVVLCKWKSAMILVKKEDEVHHLENPSTENDCTYTSLFVYFT